MAWLTGFNNRLKLTISPDNVDSSLSDFPVMVYLSSNSGKNSFDATAVFDELFYADRKKIAITTNDGTTQCPVEIEYWDNTEEKAVLWTKVPTVYSSVDTDLYFYYDATTSGNTTYVGDVGDATAQSVWDSNFVGVWHMSQSPPSNNKVLRAAEVTSTGDPAIATTTFGPINCTGLTKANGTFIIELKCSDSSNIDSSPPTTIEITSAGTYDSEEWAHSLTADDLSKLSTTYKTFIWPMSDWNTSGGELVVDQIDYIRWFAYAITGTVSIYWKNARIIWPDGEEHILLDSTSNANNGIPEESMTTADLVDGKVGKAIDFDGSNDYISCGNSATLQPNSITASVIIKPSGWASTPILLQAGQSNGQSGYLFLIGTDGKLRFLVRNSANTAWLFELAANAAFTAENWYQIDGVYASGKGEFYINGVKQTAVSTATGNIGYGTANFTIGKNLANRYFDGISDEVRISNIDRSAAWIKATYYSNWDNLIVFQQEEITTNWLTDWSKRIKLTIDHTKVDTTLVDFPVAITLASGTGINNKDVTDIFNTLTITGTLLFSDYCDGTFGDNWIDNSNGDSYGEYNSGRLSLDLNNGSDTEAVNVLSNDSYSCIGFYTIEFDWYPVAGGSWFDDDFSDAQNSIKIVRTSPAYNAGSWKYNVCEYEVGVNSFIGLYLRSSKSNVVTMRQRINGADTNLINKAFTYGVSHHVKWEIDFDNYITSLYIDGNLIDGDISWNSSILAYIGGSFKYNFHWHSYAKTDNQRYDNIIITKGIIVSNELKIAITTNDGVTQCPVEIERWDVPGREANLWTKVPIIESDEDTYLYLYYDKNQPDNTTYVGNTGDAVAQNVWDDNFVGVYHMAQDPNGDVADSIKDSTSNANHGTSAGSMTSADLVDGKIGKAIDFDGSDDYINTTDIDIGNSITMEVTFKRNSIAGDWESLLGKYNGTLSNYELTFFGTTNKIRHEWTYNGGSWKAFDSDTLFSSITSFYYVAGTRTDTTAALYTNGVFDKGTTWAGTVDNFDSADFRIARRGTGQPCNVIIDEVRISNTARQAAWVKATYYSNWNDLITYGSEQDIPIFLFNGYVQVEGAPAARVVYLYRRSTGDLMGVTTSSSSDGYFEIGSNYNEYHFVVILPKLTETYDLIAHDKIDPEI